MNMCFLFFLLICSVNLNGMHNQDITPHNMTEILDKVEKTRVTLPSAEVLKERILSIPRFQNGTFLGKSKLHESLANQECNLMFIVLLLKRKLFVYHNFFKTWFQDDLIFELIKIEKTTLCKKILQEYPDAYKILQEAGIIEDWL